MAALNIEQARRRCLDLANEADQARMMNASAMRKALHSCALGLDNFARFLMQAQISAAEGGIAIEGDLALADMLAGAQRKWNHGDIPGGQDGLLEALAYMERVRIDVETTEDVQ